MDLSLKTTQQATISNKENLKSLRRFRMSQKHQKTSVIVRQSNTSISDCRRSGVRASEEKPGDNSSVECPVCGEITINHSHYGGVVCDSCKAFFRRTVVNPSKKSERCRLGNGICSLRKERRNNCPFCRFKLCLQTGMKPDMIKIKASAATEIKREGRFSPVNTDLACEDHIEQILRFHNYILSQTSGVNLMTIPGQFLSRIDERISSGANSGDQNQDTISIARLECNFLKVKQKLFENHQKDQEHNMFQLNDSGSKIFTAIQELILELVIIFMKQCRFFQALTWDCTSRLLRKNITDITVLLLIMSYERKESKFRWRFSSSPVEVDRLTITRYFGPEIAGDIFQFVMSFSQLEIPGHVLIVLILICLYSRGGMPMKKQEKIDGARHFYQQLLFRYIKGTNSEDVSSRFNATLHRALKSVNDFGEKMRSFKIFNIHTNIQSI